MLNRADDGQMSRWRGGGVLRVPPYCRAAILKVGQPSKEAIHAQQRALSAAQDHRDGRGRDSHARRVRGCSGQLRALQAAPGDLMLISLLMPALSSAVDVAEPQLQKRHHLPPQAGLRAGLNGLSQAARVVTPGIVGLEPGVCGVDWARVSDDD
jgi:hypothetical protein